VIIHDDKYFKSDVRNLINKHFEEKKEEGKVKLAHTVNTIEELPYRNDKGKTYIIPTSMILNDKKYWSFEQNHLSIGIRIDKRNN